MEDETSKRQKDEKDSVISNKKRPNWNAFLIYVE